jgi:hypothetical protein
MVRAAIKKASLTAFRSFRRLVSPAVVIFQCFLKRLIGVNVKLISIRNKMNNLLLNKKSAIIICSILLLCLSFIYWLNDNTDLYLVQEYEPSMVYPNQIQEVYYLGHVHYNKLTERIYIGNIEAKQLIKFFKSGWRKRINNGYVENVSLDEWNKIYPILLYDYKSCIFNIGRPLYPKGTVLPVKITDKNQIAYLDDFYRNRDFKVHWLELVLGRDYAIDKVRAKRFFSKSAEEFEALKYQDTYIPFTKKASSGPPPKKTKFLPVPVNVQVDTTNLDY